MPFSEILETLQNSPIEIVWNAFVFFLIFKAVRICISILNYVIWRQKFSKLPATKLRFFNLFGNVSDLPLAEHSRNGQSIYVSMYQLLLGYAKLLEQEKLYCLWMFFHPLVVLLKAEAVEAVYKEKKTSDKGVFYQWVRIFFGNSILTSATHKWKSQRKLMNPCFRPGIIRDHLQTINEHSQKLVKRLERKTEKNFINIYKYISDCALDIVCGLLYGVDVGAQESKKEAVEFLDSIIKGFSLISNRALNILLWKDFIFYRSKTGKEVKKHTLVAKDFIKNLIKKEKQTLLKNPRPNEKKELFLVKQLLNHHFKSPEMSIEDITEELLAFVVEGHDTTKITISWLLHLLGLDKAIQSKVHQELDSIFGDDQERHATMEDINSMKYLECAIKETLRLFPPVPILARDLSEDTTICGYQLPKGTTCVLFPHVLHRDEKVFPNAEKFIPERFLPENSASRHPYAWAPFSAGPRNCIGMKLAFMELLILASTILRKYTVESLDHRDKVLPALAATLDSSMPIRIKLRPRHLKEI